MAFLRDWARQLSVLAGAFLGITLCIGSVGAQISIPSSGNINTIAGTAFEGYAGDGGAATSATFNTPSGLAVDSVGNVYIADQNNNAIRKIDATTGTITTYAGTGTCGFSGDGGAATSAQLCSPTSVAVDAAGNIYIADVANGRIRKVTVSNGHITTVAGTGSAAYSGDGGPATSASFCSPTGVALDSAGNLYIADNDNMVVRKVSSATGIITTIAGNHTQGYSGDGSAATSAAFNYPSSVAVNSIGDIYILDSGNNAVRKVAAATGLISTVAGNGTAGYSGDGGAATSAEINSPWGNVSIDLAGNLFISDFNNNRVRMVSAASGEITTVAGNGTQGFSGDGGAATSAELNGPAGVAADSSGNLYFVDGGNLRVRAVGSFITEPPASLPTITWASPSPITYGAGLSSTQLNATASVAGTFTYIPAGGTVLSGGTQSLTAIFVPTDTTHYSPVMKTVSLLVNQANPVITWTAPAPMVYGTPLSSLQLDASASVSGSFVYSPAAGSVPNLGTQTLGVTFYPTDSIDYASVTASQSVLVRLTPSSQIITTFAGDGYHGYWGDGGPAWDAALALPLTVRADASGNVYISDLQNYVVRKVDAITGVISTVVGNGTQGYSGDGGAATSAEINGVSDFAFDSSGNLYIADSNNNCIRKITLSTGIITTVVGDGTAGYSGDGSAATAAELNDASGLTFDSSGNMFIADFGNNVIRKVSASTGDISTVVGNGTQGYSGDGGAALSAELNGPGFVAFDAAGDLYFQDWGNNVLREVKASDGTVATVVGNGTVGYAGDGGPATAASLNLDGNFVLDPAGNLYTTDSNNNVIRMVSASTQIITTVVGTGTAGFSGDGGPAVSAELYQPENVGLDSAGNLYIADFRNLRIRVVGAMTSTSVAVAVSPADVALSASQTATFSATVTNTTNTAVTWSVSPSGTGSVSTSGVYTAPSSIPVGQSVIVTATSAADPTKSSSAVVVLEPVSVSVSPANVTVSGGQTQQFTATLTDAPSTAVTWSLSTGAPGSLNSSGLYSAPAAITTEQVVTVTATSVADTTKSSSATITLLPPQCGASTYGYERSIVIDQNQVPNTDQANFPFLFSSTDPALKSAANGGHVASAYGYDLMFSTDPNGLTSLNYELEYYNPATGQVIAWVQLPKLSHSSDTVLYLFYGNPSVMASQANPAGVWSSSYQAVYHLTNVSSSTTSDSTTNANSATLDSVTSATGEIYAAAALNGSSSYLDIPSAAFAPSASTGGTGSLTFSSWFSTTTGGVILGVTGGGTGEFASGAPGSAVYGTPMLYVDSTGNVRADLSYRGSGVPQIITPATYNDGNWHLATLTFTNGIETLFVDGISQGSEAISGIGFGTGNSLTVGTGQTFLWAGGNGWWYYFGGNLDEVRITDAAQSSDWALAEYRNQSAPSQFYTLYPEDTGSVRVSPPAVTLYASGMQQFSTWAKGVCGSPSVEWSMPAGTRGTLSSEGLYVAPSTIDEQQTVTLTATTTGDSAGTYNANITLMPPVSVTVDPPTASLTGGETQTFTATVGNTPENAVRWSVSPEGSGTVSSLGVYSAPSTIAAEATVTITATSMADPTRTASGSVTLIPAAPVLPVAVAVSPTSATVYASQTQQLTAQVSNNTNTAVTWTIEPSGVGSISSGGLYTAPSSVSAQETITIVATSQADTTKSAAAMITLAPPPCAASGYSYERAITIDHTKIPNTDQINFPFLFNTTDSTLKTVSNGGHVTSASGYDIIFSTDPSGQSRLDHELEYYNASTGQVIAWVRIPDLSHSSDTVLYVFYGNSSITSSQQNPAGVWDANYQAVYHFANSGSSIASDSSANTNNGTVTSVSNTSGEIDGAGSFDGSSSFVQIPSAAFASYPDGFTASFETWFKTTSSGVIFGQTDGTEPGGSPSSYVPALYVDYEGLVRSSMFWHGSGDDEVHTATAYNDGNWHSAADTYVNGTETLYVDGQVAGSQQVSNADYGSSYAYFLGTGYTTGGWPFTNGPWFYFNGNLDEVHVSNIGRSSDWLTAEFNNQGSPSTFYSWSAENTEALMPTAVSLYGGQSQQFSAVGSCNGTVSWSMTSGAPGTLTSGGFYTAPSSITTQQSVTITAANTSNPSNSASATITLYPPLSVSVTPSSTTLTADQAQQLEATVSNSPNTAVTWTISPSGVGTLSPTGLYAAPSSITSSQTLTITATSQEDSTKYAQATITLTPPQAGCASSGYGYQRIIVIDHTKVPNSDQANFPFLFNSTDADLATLSNGGHVMSSTGNDIIFSLDPSGTTKLDHELEYYNPATGQVVAWIRIPTLTHNTNTVLYMFYGNPNVTGSQANPGGVWDSDYTAVYHLANVSGSIATDSTGNSATNSGTLTSVSASSGEIDGAAAFNGTSSYIKIPETDFPSFPTGTYSNLGTLQTGDISPFAASFGVWFKTSTAGGILVQAGSPACISYALGNCISTGDPYPGLEDPSGSWGDMLYVDDNGKVNMGGGIISPSSYNDNQWHYAVITYSNDATAVLYVDGQNVGSVNAVTVGYSASYDYFVGTGYTYLLEGGNWDWLYFNGSLDEVSVSKVARSADWIRTEYNNQSSPSTFYHLYAVGTVQVAPATASLYAAQTQQFTVAGICNADVSWSMSSSAPGSLTSAGLYTAPDSFTAGQTVTLTATNSTTSTTLGTAVVTLLAAPSPATLTAANSSPYAEGTSQTFTVSLVDQYGKPEPGILVTFTVSGANNVVHSATTAADGTSSFAYLGSNAGHDTIQASADVNENQVTSNSLTVTWNAAAPPASGPSVTLVPQPSPGLGGLMGAFTDSSGDVIQPVAIGSSPRTLVVPTGATQFQLGIDDNYYADDGGAGYSVTVNGSSVTVPPTAMPWSFVTGGLNNNYQYSLNDGTAPKLAASSLTAGQSIRVAYQSGTVSTNYPLTTLTDANGNPSALTTVSLYQGTYYPTLYTTASSYPVGQPITFSAVVVDSTGAPMASVPVAFNVSGANPGTYSSTTDSTGTATLLYTGAYAGADSLQAVASPSGGSTLDSALTTVTWVSYPTPPTPGTLTLSLIGTDVNLQGWQLYAADSTGTPIKNANIGLYVTGADDFQTSVVTDETGHAEFSYYHVNDGTYSVLGADSVGRNLVTTSHSGTWPPATPTISGGSNGISIDISYLNTVTLPNTLSLSATVSDTSSVTPTVAWSKVSGPGTVTFSASTSLTTTASFTEIGDYVLQLSANDTSNTASVPFTVTVYPNPDVAAAEGRIGSPTYGSSVNGIVPIVLAPGVTLTSGTLVYYPANTPSNVTTLNSSTTGSGQVGTFDTTMLPNGSYWIALQSTDTSSSSEYDLALVTVTGNYKPGRVTSTATDLVVPAKGLPIQIQRVYDSLNANTVGDFGYGWNLSTNVNLTVDNNGNVTFTLNGQRRTFYLAPQPNLLFGAYYVGFNPEPGLHGTLTDSAPGCASDFDFVLPYGSLWVCVGGGLYSPPGYVYTDPTGTAYTISASGNLQSIVDRSGNGLTITASGITSTTGLNVPFVRDTSGRITQITDPAGNVYHYSYDTSGNLETVTYPTITTPSSFTYNSGHQYLSGTDFLGNALPTTVYYGSTDVDVNGLPLNGRLHTVTDALSETTTYAYNLLTNTTTITYPPDANGNTGTATVVYDNLGSVLSSTDPLSHTTTNVYDANENLVSTTDPLSHTTTYTYDNLGNKTSTTYPATSTSTNTTSTTVYNQYSEPTSTTDENGNVRLFNYDGNFNPLSVTDSVGTLSSFLFNSDGTLQAGAIGYDISALPAMASQFTYDSNGNLASRTDALGRTTLYTYNSLGQKTSMVQPLLPGTSASQATTSYTYDDFGNLTQTAAPLSRTTGSTYDGNGNKLSGTDARGNTTNYTYDALNRLTTTTYPPAISGASSTTATKTYDFRGNVIRETDQNGHVTLHQYDLAGEQTSVTTGYSSGTVSCTSGSITANTTCYTYYADGRKHTETDALGDTTTYTYDAAGNMTATSGVKGTFTYGYDNARNQITVTDGNSHTTHFAYDSRKRLTVTTYPDSTTKTNAYDGPGNLASVTDQAGNVVEYTYDAANQLVSTVQVNSPNAPANTTIDGYDNNGNPVVLTDANDHTTATSFDLLGEVTAKTLPDQTHTESRTYDDNGNLVTLTHFNGVTTTYTYDTLNRLLSRATPGETTVSFTYTPTGKYASSTDTSGTTTYTYDSMDRLTAKATPQGTLNYTFDAAGHVASIYSSNTNGASMSYTYDSLNRLSTVVDNRLSSGANTTTYTYDSSSNVATVTYPNGIESTFTYDNLNRVTDLSSAVSGYSYTYGPTGNRTAAAENGGRTIAWTYDGIYRLTNEAISSDPAGKNGSAGYTLDPVGNRLSASSTVSGLSPVSGTFNADDELASETYDNNGNVTASGGKTFAYDSQNHLTSMNSGAVTIVYDAFGNRVSKTVGGVTTQYLVEDDVNPTGYPQVFDELVGGAVARTYTYGLQRISEEQQISSAWTPSFYGYDGFGTVRQLTNLSGTVTDTYDYDAFGNALITTGSTPNNYLYRGEQYDSDLGLYYLRARYYNPTTGRFMSRDPEDGQSLDPKSMHKYLYVGGDPINGIDPWGREDLFETGIRLAKDAAAATAAHVLWSIPLSALEGSIVARFLVAGEGKGGELAADVAIFVSAWGLGGAVIVAILVP